MTITAKYASKCPLCGNSITPGEKVEWQRGEKARHTRCPAAQATTTAAAPTSPATAPLRLSGGSGYGCTGWTAGQVILSGEKRRREGGPDGLVVVRASRRYVRDDGMSFGVGDEQGFIYSAECRAATREELAPAIDAAHGEALAMERTLEVGRIEALFATADPPRVDSNGGQQYVPAGDEVPLVRGRMRIYGGGLWAVVGPEWIWLCRGNGADGDMWDANNVRTQGAGAIGRRLPYDENLAARLRALATTNPKED